MAGRRDVRYKDKEDGICSDADTGRADRCSAEQPSEKRYTGLKPLGRTGETDDTERSKEAPCIGRAEQLDIDRL